MLLLNPVGSPVQTAIDAAEKLKNLLPDSLSGAAKLTCSVLSAVGIETTKRRGYSLKTTHVTFHCPLEIVAMAVGVDRTTLWRHLPALKEFGLIDYRTHKGAFFGETRNTGTLWQIRLNPRGGKKAKLSNEELRHKWRNLEADYKRYRLSSLTLKRHAATYTKDSPNIDLILEWAAPLTPVTKQNPVKPVCCKPLECLLDVVSAPREDRNNMVKLAAEALASALSDSGSVSWYQRLLWQLLRTYDATGEDYSYQVYLMAVRARVDRTEGFARRAGALFHARLKQAEWFEAVMNAPPNRVGTKPDNAAIA